MLVLWCCNELPHLQFAFLEAIEKLLQRYVGARRNSIRLLSLDKFMIDFTVILKDYDDNNNNGGGVVEFIC